MSDLSDRLAQIEGLTLTSVHVGLTDWAELKYLADEWQITLSYNGKEYGSTYRTGIGHRKVKPGVKKERGGYATLTESPKSEALACRRGWLKLVQPDIADVVSCLMCDASSGQETFVDFCSNMGGNVDSRKDLDMYLRCQDALIGLRKLFGYDLLDELMKLSH